MDHGVNPGSYGDVVLFLATAGIVVPLFKRLKISPILGFLGAGVALGPYGLGALARQAPWLQPLAVANPHDIAELAEFGVVFLLFSSAPARFRGRRSRSGLQTRSPRACPRPSAFQP